MVEQSGLSLDQQWDLYIDESTGDIGIDTAVDEVKKDLALAVGCGVTSQQIEGAPLDPGQLADVELYIRKLVRSDPRVSSVPNVAVDGDGTTDTLSVAITAELGTFEQVVEEDIDSDGVPEQIRLEVSFENGELVEADVLSEVA
jgi:hypothetical protein